MLRLLFLLGFTGVAACSVLPEDRAGTGVSAGLESATITGIYDYPVKLRDGRYEGKPFVPGGASRPTVTLLHEPRAHADIDDDGEPEWIAVLAESSGGSGTFAYLAVVKEDRGRFHSIGTAFVGDRVTIRRIAADGKNLRVDVLASEEDTFSCCPTGLRTLRWQWTRGDLESIVNLAGKLVYGSEVREFKTCGGRRFAVRDFTGGDLKQVYKASTGVADRSLFAEVLAIISPVPDAGFAGTYDEQVRITELLRMEPEGHGCQLDLGDARFRASGVEPFWHLDAYADTLHLSRPGQATREYVISASESDAATGSWWAESVDNKLELNLRKERCADGMSGAIYSYSAEIRLAGEVLKGCAVTPLPGEPRRSAIR